MTRVLIKICGLRDTAAIDAALAGGADFIGLVFFGPSPRNVAPAQAAALVSHVAGRVPAVGLFVDPAPDFLAEVLGHVPLDILQLHGSETPADCAAIAARHARPVWKALGVRTRADALAADRYAGAAQRVLFDAKPPPGSALPGGNGLRIDWQVLNGVRPALPWMLAGGLTPDTVREAILATGAPAVDVSSGVESAPGVKDPALIRAFCASVNG